MQRYCLLFSVLEVLLEKVMQLNLTKLRIISDSDDDDDDDGHASSGTIIGVILAILVGIIIIGGIKRIASVTEKVVPFMALLYLVACLYIILSNFSLVDDAFGLIFNNAFNPQAAVGGIFGVILIGFKRAAFSN